MSAVEEFEKLLQALSASKNGISASKINSINMLAITNVQESSRFVTLLFKHFKKTPGPLKLGVLYAVDSISRAFYEQARKSGQPLESTDEGTFGGGLSRITAVIESLMNDVMLHAPEDHKDKIKKLLDIWEKAGTFPQDVMNSIRTKHFSSTPLGSPVRAKQGSVVPLQANPSSNWPTSSTQQAAPTNTGAILQALAALAKQKTPISTVNVPSTPNPTVPSPPVTLPPVAAQPPLGVSQPPVPTVNTQIPSSISDSTTSFAQQQTLLAQLLLSQGVPLDQIQAILLANITQNQRGQVPAPDMPSVVGYPNANHRSPSPSPSRNRSSSRSRSRSRTPIRRHSPNRKRRRSPSYEEYRGRDNRSRSPGGRSRSMSRSRSRSLSPRDRIVPRRRFSDKNPEPPKNKPVVTHMFEMDNSVGPGNIKAEPSSLEACPTVIHNRAWNLFLGVLVKCKAVWDDAIAAKHGLEELACSVSLRTRWGVGFGPRDCSDFSTGTSIIPISRLTEADKKWLVTAEHGGTGGRPIVGGMVVEEPDIQIGQGVSSKAISKRMSGPGTRGGSSRGRGRGNYNSSQPDHQPMPQFPFPPPMFPPGMAPFGFPGFPMPGMPSLNSNAMPQGYVNAAGLDSTKQQNETQQ